MLLFNSSAISSLIENGRISGIFSQCDVYKRVRNTHEYGEPEKLSMWSRTVDARVKIIGPTLQCTSTAKSKSGSDAALIARSKQMLLPLYI